MCQDQLNVEAGDQVIIETFEDDFREAKALNESLTLELQEAKEDLDEFKEVLKSMSLVKAPIKRGYFGDCSSKKNLYQIGQVMALCRCYPRVKQFLADFRSEDCDLYDLHGSILKAMEED